MLACCTSLTGFHNQCYKTIMCSFDLLAENDASLVPKRFITFWMFGNISEFLTGSLLNY